MILYDYWRSTASYRVRMALHLKGQPFKTVPVNLKEGEQKLEEHKKINPQGLVPALVVNGEIFTQSLAVIEYLDETCIGAPLMPKDEEGKAKVRALSHIISSDLHPLNNLRVLQYLQNELNVNDENKQKWYEHWIHEAFQTLETMTEPDALYLHGNHITMADICLIAQMYNVERFNIEVSAYPKLNNIYNHLKNKAEIKAAHPSKYEK
ncbi:MAG: maleylacetoacetate isomerase [Magnetococcales bacterium]|nr:maleylacetoacetate isomerase [Magnetococcales bacterium]